MAHLFSEEDKINVICCKLPRMSDRVTSDRKDISKTHVNYLYNTWNNFHSVQNQ